MTAAFDPNAIFQTSTMAALLEGVYEGNVTIGELLEHGDFGLGTFNALDGEMLVLDGVCYHLRGDGTAAVAGTDELTPFAAVAWFRPDRRIEVTEPCDRSAVKALIDESLETTNLMVAVRTRGDFSTVRVRTVTRQEQPYRPFTEATQDQQELTFSDISGTLAAFRMPDFQQGIAVAGFHSHFIDTAHQSGGHVLDYHMLRGVIELAVLSEMRLSLQRTPQFLQTELHSDDMESRIRQTEGS